jgi:rRNA-processing protein FCF1/GNAT superfamily N-acetyltransferase
MNILIDTNILIPLEDTARELDPSLAQMCRLADANGHFLFIHMAQREDIERDRNESRRKIVLSRLEQYQTIPAPPQISDAELQEYGWKQEGDNDRIDNLLLHALCRGAVHFLVTNDKGIHRKARQAQVQEQVHYLEQFLAFLESQIGKHAPPPFGIQDRYLHEFSVCQPFFNSLREGYEGFNAWYLRSAQAQRKAWCISDNDTVQAICIYKIEQKPCIVDGGSPLSSDALKLCTFKIGHAVRGRKLGERLLFTAFKYAVEQGIEYVYLHTFGKEQAMLVSLCEDFGFQLAGKYKERDDVYLKKMCPPKLSDAEANPLDYAIEYYPHYIDGPGVDKFIVPIMPQYHNDLFADISDNAKGLFADDLRMYAPQANTIKKAYLSHANTKKIRPGSLLLFYRTHDRRSIECIGVVEQTYRGRDIDKVLPLVSKRTVYSRKEIEDQLKKETLIILFRLLRTFSPIKYFVIERAGIKGPIQSMRKISHEQYEKCIHWSVN